MPAPLGLDTDRDEGVGVSVLGGEIRIQEYDLRRRGELREIEAFAPDQHEVGVRTELGLAFHRRREERPDAGGVRILVAPDQKFVVERLAGGGHPIRLQETRKALTQGCLERRELLVGTPGGQHRHRVLRRGDQRSCGGDGGVEVDRLPLQHRLLRARALEDPREIAALVADPRAVHRGILERGHARDAAVLPGIERAQVPLGLAMPEVDRAAARAPGAYRGRRLQVPDPGLVEERARQQRPHGADVDDVVGIRVGVEGAILGGAHQRAVAPVLDAERAGLGDLVREAHAARAQDAALVVEHDALGQIVELGRADLRHRGHRRRAVVLEVVVLQRALAGLVADAAVHRMVQRDELHRRLAVRPHELGVGQHPQALGHRQVACDFHPAAALDLNGADAAIAGDRQLRVPAEVRDEEAVRLRGLHDRLVVGGHDRLPVDEDLRHGRESRGCRRISIARAR